MMDFKITNIYGNTSRKDKGYKSDYGNAFLIESGNKIILFDTGWKGNILLHNLRSAGVDPDSIDVLVFSHGHFDHTRGLEAFLKHRTSNRALKIFLHPDAIKEKNVKFIGKTLLFIKLKERFGNLGFTDLPANLKKKVIFEFITDPQEIIPKLFTLGEISVRDEKDATLFLLQKQCGRWVQDKVMDDLSLVCDTDRGLILICGCCHAGLLNTLNKIVKTWPDKKIHSIVGGTHLMICKKKELEYIGNILRDEYQSPKLYLNHCSGENTISFFDEKFGKEISRPMYVGDSLEI
jgi:7,8-dihydropterin-6-yl-methyl-4-(beta-D-ribofuranosyl)aminobenzene 5'-phosphate synthase